MIRVVFLPVALLLLASGLVGCSKKSLAPAKISGTLTYNGKPVKGGTMVFHGPDKVQYAATINSDGTYTATDIPEGELVVTVETESINPARKGGSGGKDAERRLKVAQQPPPGGASSVPDPSENYVKIPEKYANPNTSPLSITLKSGRQVENIELKD